MTQEIGRSGADAPSGLRPSSGAAKASPAEPLVPNAHFSPGPWRVAADTELPLHLIWTVSDDGPGTLLGRTCFAFDSAANALLMSKAPKLYAALESVLGFLRHAPLESGVCCCGNPIDGHGYGDGHSPVDELQYHAGGLADELAAVLAEASAIEARRAETPESGSVHESAVPKADAQGDRS